MRSSLPALLLRHAATHPEEPWLFYPDGWDLRWRSWRSVADQVRAGALALDRAGIPAGVRVAYTWRRQADGIAADLAIQAAGRLPLPSGPPPSAPSPSAPPPSGSSPSGPSEPAPRLWLPGEEGAPPGAPRLPEARAPWEASPVGWEALEAPVDRPVDGADPSTAGGVCWGPQGPWEVSPEALAGAVRELSHRLERAGEAWKRGAAPEREILAASLDLATGAGRTLLAWVLGERAVLVLEPEAESLAGTAAWARATAVALEGAQGTALEEQVRKDEAGRGRTLGRALRHRLGRPRRRPFGRLRWLLRTDGVESPGTGFWEAHGVAMVAVPEPGGKP